MKRLAAIGMSLLLAALISAMTPPPSIAREKGPALHRADFRITGASCVLCLRRIGKTFRAQKGVLKADVSIFRPYWSIVIYDANQTNMKSIIASIANEHVKVEEIEDKSINQMPVVIIPKHISTPAGAPLDGSPAKDKKAS